MRSYIRYVIIALCLGVSTISAATAGEVRAAVAANFTAPVRQIAAQFTADTGHVVTLAFGSTGKFYAQIKAGAPFDVLLAADVKTPRKLIQEGLAAKGSEFTYAIGKLVLWSKTPDLVDSKGRVLQGQFGTLAIANAKLAPYGLAAQETLTHLGLWDAVQKHLVVGESISQTMQFADTGNANLAFIALSQTVKHGKPIEGSLWHVPSPLYNPIRQDAVRLLNKTQDQTAIIAFLKYLTKPQAVAIIRSYGYNLP